MEGPFSMPHDERRFAGPESTDRTYDSWLYPPAFQMDPALCPLRKEGFCPFMLWVTLPRNCVNAMMHYSLETGWNFGMVGPEMAEGPHILWRKCRLNILLRHLAWFMR